MKSIAIIPARCGSQDIPNKNIYPVCGKPLISYSIDALAKSYVDDYYVSTDCHSISTVCRQCNAKVINRPKDISGNNSPTIECVQHAINALKLNDEDILLTIQATSPLIKPEDINQTINKLDDYEYVISVCNHHKILWKKNQNNITPFNHDAFNRKRRQDMDEILCETGSIYATRVKNINKYNSLHGNKSVGYVLIPKTRSFEVDDYEDITIIESILKNEHSCK